MSDSKHRFGPDGKCVVCCMRSCADAFWVTVADGLGMDPPPDGTDRLSLRPDAAPKFHNSESR